MPDAPKQGPEQTAARGRRARVCAPAVRRGLRRLYFSQHSRHGFSYTRLYFLNARARVPRTSSSIINSSEALVGRYSRRSSRIYATSFSQCSRHGFSYTRLLFSVLEAWFLALHRRFLTPVKPWLAAVFLNSSEALVVRYSHRSSRI